MASPDEPTPPESLNDLLVRFIETALKSMAESAAQTKRMNTLTTLIAWLTGIMAVAVFVQILLTLRQMQWL